MHGTPETNIEWFLALCSSKILVAEPRAMRIGTHPWQLWHVLRTLLYTICMCSLIGNITLFRWLETNHAQSMSACNTTADSEFVPIKLGTIRQAQTIALRICIFAL